MAIRSLSEKPWEMFRENVRRMKLSVEISTYNRRNVLRLVLQKLSEQTYPLEQFEVVISDDGSSDGTAEMIESMKEAMPYPVKYLSHQHLGSGPSHNIGIRESDALIVFPPHNTLLM